MSELLVDGKGYTRIWLLRQNWQLSTRSCRRRRSRTYGAVHHQVFSFLGIKLFMAYVILQVLEQVTRCIFGRSIDHRLISTFQVKHVSDVGENGERVADTIRTGISHGIRPVGSHLPCLWVSVVGSGKHFRLQTPNIINESCITMDKRHTIAGLLEPPHCHFYLASPFQFVQRLGHFPGDWNRRLI